DVQRSAPAARHVREATRERDVLRRPVAGRSRKHVAGTPVEDAQLVAIARGHPDMPAVGPDADVVRKEVRAEAPEESRPRSLADVHDCELPRLRPERDPEGPAGRIDRDVTCTRAHSLAMEHATAHDVDRDDVAASGVGDVCVPTVGMRRRVPRLVESVQRVPDAEPPYVDEADGADL